MVWTLNFAFALLVVYGCAGAELPSRGSQKEANEENDAPNDQGSIDEGSTDVQEDPCTNAECGENKGDPKDPPAEFSLLGSYGRMSRQPWIRWEKSAGATSYHVKITNDKDCNDVVVEKKNLQVNELRLSSVATGEKFLCVSASNADGTTRVKNDALPVKVVQGWIKASTEGWASLAKSAISTTWTGEELVTFGGIVSNGNDAQDDIHAFNPATDRWRKIELQNPKPPAQFHSLLGYHANKLWIWGKYSDKGSYVVDLRSGVRSSGAGDNPPAFAAYSALAVVGDKFFRFGGSGQSTKGYWFDPKSNAWTDHTTDGPVSRQSHCVVATDKEVIVFGSANTGEAMNVQTGTWRSVPAPASGLDGFHSPCGWDGKFFYRYSGSAAGRLDVETGIWEEIDLTGGPSNRTNATGTWVGEAFAIVGGGSTFETYLYYP